MYRLVTLAEPSRAGDDARGADVDVLVKDRDEEFRIGAERRVVREADLAAVVVEASSVGLPTGRVL